MTTPTFVVTIMLHFLTVMAANKDLNDYFSKFLESGWRMATRLGVGYFYVLQRREYKSIYRYNVVGSNNKYI